MSSDIAIRVVSLGKCYQIYRNPRDRLKQFVFPRINKIFTEKSVHYYQEFWALRDVFLEIKRGETIGILGRNGSGKSTLLQLICGTLTPTTGTIEISGRVAALLELGSGFNPEFTGRENVYMNAAILGLNQKEIDAKYDDIVAFADIGDFIEQPVKTYSSGMYVRLAFSVQIMVDPDILIIDEALAVGDARFQLKCFQRLESLKQNGTTIVLVTHSIEQIRTFCDNGLVLNDGRPVYYGDSKTAAVKYYQIIFPEENSTLLNSDIEERDEQQAAQEQITQQKLTPDMYDESSCYVLHIEPGMKSDTNFGSGGAQINWIKIYGLTEQNIIGGGETIKVDCSYSWNKNFLRSVIERNFLKSDVSVGIALADDKGQYIFGCNGFDANLFVDCYESDEAILRFEFILPYLKSGTYFLTVSIPVGTMENHVQLIWYDYLVELKCISAKKNVYGVCHLDYVMKRIK